MKNCLVMQMNHVPHRRAGITLMEVLIAVGILAVGLSSVVALLPAGHSLAQRSFVTDQAALVAANAAADFITQGLLRSGNLNAAAPPLIFDPTYDPSKPNAVCTWPTGNPLVLKTDGVFASPSSAAFRSAQPVSGYLVRARDDLVYDVPESANDDVRNRFNAAGIREYQGKFTWAAMLARADGSASPLRAGDEAVLTIVVFHQREAGTPQLNSTLAAYAKGSMTWSQDLVAGRRDRDVLRTGGVVLLVPQAGGSPSLRRLSLAAFDGSGSKTAFVSFEGGTPAGANSFAAYVIPDAVALLERNVTIEHSSGYAP